MRKDMPRVSVIIPCYNYAHFLQEAVESVIMQTYKDFEIIIVNDESTDNTKEIAEELLKTYSHNNIKVLNQVNKGVAAARNNGIASAAGEYVVCMDADDYIEPTFLEETVKVLDNEPDISIAYTEFQMFGNITEAQRFEKMGIEYELDQLIKVDFIPTCSLYRKSAWADVGGYKNMGYEDWEFWINLGKYGHIGKFINKRLFNYRRHGPSKLAIDQRNHELLCYQIKKLHPRLYCPKITNILGDKIALIFIGAPYYFNRLNNNAKKFFRAMLIFKEIERAFRKKVRNPIKEFISGKL